jgi:hypothetical protein
LEERFGEDFSAVRVHDGLRAANDAGRLNANAYTIGEGIIFGGGRYAPETFEGKRLLAHELAHVVQQRRRGTAPTLEPGSAIEQAAEAAARSALSNARGIAVDGASGIGVAREPAEDDISKAFHGWTKLDRETEEEARRKPPKRDEATETTTPAANPPPGSAKLDPVLKEKSRALRAQRNDLLARRQEAREAGEDPSKIKPKSRVTGVRQYQDAVRAASRDPAADEVRRHEAAVTGQPAMTHEDMFNKTLAMRGFDAGTSVWEWDKQKQDYDELKRKLRQHPEAPAINALHAHNRELRREIAKLKREEQKKGKLSEEDQARREKLKQTLEANTKTIEASPVTALGQQAGALRNRLALSALRSPDAREADKGPGTVSKGAAAGRGENTYAVIQVIGPDGKILAWAPGKNSAEGHAEQNALVQIRRQVAGMKGGLPPGSKIEVVGDQVVCSEICKPDLAEFAATHHVDRVDGYTFHAVKPSQQGKAQGGPELSAKKTAREATTAAAGTWALRRKHEPIYTKEGGLQGGGQLTPGEKHRHKHDKQRRKTESTPAAGAKGAPVEHEHGKKRSGAKPTTAAGAKAPPMGAEHTKHEAKAAAPHKGAKAKPVPQQKSTATGKAPPAREDMAKTPERRRAAPTAHANTASVSPPVRGAAPARRATPEGQRRTVSKGEKAEPGRRVAPLRKKEPLQKTEAKTLSAKPPAAPKRKQAAPPQVKPKRETRGSPGPGGAALLPSPAAKSLPARRTAKPSTKPAATPPAQAASATTAPPAAQRKPPPPLPLQSKGSTEVTRGGGAFLAPGTTGTSGQIGVSTTQQRGKGVTTGQSVSLDGAVTLDIKEVSDTQPQRYRVTLHVDLGAQAGVSATRENRKQSARAGVGLTASGSFGGSFSHELSAERAEKYRTAVAGGGAGNYQELEIVRLLADKKTEAADALLQQLKNPTGSAEAAKHLGKGDVAEVSAQGTVGGTLSASGGKQGGSGAGVELGLFRSGHVERRVEERDGKIVVTMTIASETGHTLGGTASEGVASFGVSGTAAKSNLRSVSFALDPGDKDFDAKFNEITTVTSIEQLDALRGKRRDLAGATAIGKGKSGGHKVTAGVLGVGVGFSQGGSFSEQETRDEQGVSHHYEASGSGGMDVSVGDRTVASTKATDTFVADVGPDNAGSGETRSERRESDLGRSIDKLQKSFAKNPVTTATGILTGKTQVLQERVDSSGAALTDASFGRLASLAEDPAAWDHAWSADVGAFIDWQKTRRKVLTAHGDRNAIARAIGEFESGGSERSGTVEKAVGGTGIAFEFPDELADQKPVYDSLIVGNPVGHAKELAERGQQEAALNELRTANDRLGRLVSAVQAQSGAFESEAKLAQMLNRVADRRSELRAEIRRLSTPAKPLPNPAPSQAEGGDTGAPAVPARDEEAQRRAAEDLMVRQDELTRNCATLRGKEQAAFAHIREEMGSWHFDHLSASIDMARLLKKVKDGYTAWDESVQNLKTVLKDRRDNPDKADALGPDRKQWDAVNAMWQTW